MRTLSKANTTAQWYADDYEGSVFTRLDKLLLHSTETKSWPGYGGGASAPNATYHPGLRQIRQHYPNLMSSRALRDPSGTAVRENRDNVFQLEIIAFSNYSLARQYGGLWIGDLTDSHFTDLAQIAKELNQYHRLPLSSTVQWKEGQKTYVSGVRLSGPSYDAYRGILAHMHASGNTHWDVGGFRYSRLAKKLVAAPPPEGDDEMTPAQAAQLALAAKQADYATKQLNSIAAGISALAKALQDNDLITTDEQRAINAELSGGGLPGLSH